MADADNLARICKVLSTPTRVRIVQLLRRKALCVGALTARLGITQGAVSQHLRVLRDAGLVVAQKRGYYVHYRLNDKALARWQAAMKQFLAPDAAGTAGGPIHKRRRKTCARRTSRSARSPNS